MILIPQGSTIPLNSAAAAGLALAGSICLAGPLLLALWWRRRTGAPLSAFGIGAVVFFIAQVVLRFPWQIPLARQIQAHPEWMLPFLIFSALTAGIFEETGRWVGYRYLLRERTQRIGVMLGLGHGGLEAMLLVGVPLLGLLIGWILASRGVVEHGEALETIRRQSAPLNFWNVQLAALERASSLAAHVGLSLVVLQVWLRGSLRWLFLAIGLHFTVNTLGATLLHYLRVPVITTEVAVAVVSGGILLFGWRLNQGAAGPTAGSSDASGSR